MALGAPLAAAQTAGGKGMYWPSTAAHPKAPRGQVRPTYPREGLSLEQVLFGPTPNPWGEENLVGGLRRSMAKCGYTDLKSFQKAELAVRI